MNPKPQMKRYNLVVPMPLWREVEDAAETEAKKAVDIVRGCLRIGLLVLKAQQEGSTVVIRDGEKEQRVLFV